MLSKLLLAWCLMALCVAIHSIGLALALRWIKPHLMEMSPHFWPATLVLIGTAGWTLLMHLLQIIVWALYYVWQGGMPDLATAAYFSAVTYTTTGYGDVVLPEGWRLVGGVEALTGILMCGLSTGLFLAVFTKLFALNREGAPVA